MSSMTGIGWVSETTDSGMLGICGPYGKHATSVGNPFLASVPRCYIDEVLRIMKMPTTIRVKEGRRMRRTMRSAKASIKAAYIWILYLIFVVAPPNATPTPWPTNEIYITTIGHGLYDEKDTTFSIARDQLPLNFKWQPETEPCPANIGELVAKGAAYVSTTQHIPFELAVLQLNLSRLTIPQKRLDSNGLSKQQIENIWYLAMQFYICDFGTNEVAASKPPIVYPAVIFLNGTHPNEWTNMYAPSALSSHPKRVSVAEIGKSLPDTAIKPSEKVFKYVGGNAYDELRNPGLQLSTVLWDGFNNQFPMDIPAQAAHAKEFLSGRGVRPENLQLKGIEMEPFMEVVQKAHGVGSSNHCPHWLVNFQLTETVAPHRIYKVYMLLDGRIITFSGME